MDIGLVERFCDLHGLVFHVDEVQWEDEAM